MSEQFHVSKTRPYNRLFCRNCKMMQSSHEADQFFRERHNEHEVVLSITLKEE